MKIDGRCHCGAITYEAEIDPGRVTLCHCTDCQTLSGSPYRAVMMTDPGSFRLLTGAPTIYLKTGTSGAKREQSFCPTCGTPIYSSGVGDGPKFYTIRLGSIRQRAALAPKMQIWTRSALPWAADLVDLPKLETQPEIH